MRAGDRGLVLADLIDRLDHSPVDTLIKPLTRDEKTWHPNDRKGTRSHVVPHDVKVRGAARNIPTKAIFYVNPSRIDSKISSFKLGTFPYKLAEATDLNTGQFSGRYEIREKRHMYYRNAWRDSMGLPMIDQSGYIPTLEYQESKKNGLVTEANKKAFPILNGVVIQGLDSDLFHFVKNPDVIEIRPGGSSENEFYFSPFSGGHSFIKVIETGEEKVRFRYGKKDGDKFEIYEVLYKPDQMFEIQAGEKGFDFTMIETASRLVSHGELLPGSESYSLDWYNEIPITIR